MQDHKEEEEKPLDGHKQPTAFLVLSFIEKLWRICATKSTELHEHMVFCFRYLSSSIWSLCRMISSTICRQSCVITQIYKQIPSSSVWAQPCHQQKDSQKNALDAKREEGEWEERQHHVCQQEWLLPSLSTINNWERQCSLVRCPLHTKITKSSHLKEDPYLGSSQQPGQDHLLLL